jgi:hypothetical protein
MSGTKTKEPSATSVERTKRKLFAQQEGVRMMAEVEKEATAVRKNMERLRALRLAREAELAAQPDKPSPAAAKKPRRKT